jgi:hypothetical protein
MRLSSPLERISINLGLITGVCLIAYFLIMNQIGLSQMLTLRYFNVVILGAGVCIAINKVRNKFGHDELYLQGMGMGLFTSGIGTFVFALFMSLYLSYVDKTLLQHIKDTTYLGQYINGLAVFMIIFLEGMASGLIITFVAMQYYKSAGRKDAETAE